jgi:hypothetical protein
VKKPFDPKQLPAAVGNACERIRRAASRRKRVLEEALRDQNKKYQVVGLWPSECDRLYNLVEVKVSEPRKTWKGKRKGGRLPGFRMWGSVALRVRWENWPEYRAVADELERLRREFDRAGKVLASARTKAYDRLQKTVSPNQSVWNACNTDPEVVTAEADRHRAKKEYVRLCNRVYRKVEPRLRLAANLAVPDDVCEGLTDGVLVVCRTRVYRDSFLDDEHYEVNWVVKGYEAKEVEFYSDTRPDSVIPEDFYSL